MGDIRKKTAVLKGIEQKRSSSGNQYLRAHFHDDSHVDFYSDSWKEELRKNREDYVGLVVEVYYEDRGYIFGQAIVPKSKEKAAELLERKKSDDFEGHSEQMERGLHQWVELFYEA